MKVFHLSFTDSFEGGAIGAYRLHRAMVDNGVDSTLLVHRKHRVDDTVLRLESLSRVRSALIQRAGGFLSRLEKLADPRMRTLNLLPTGVHRIINRSDADIVQLHWIGRNTISISEIAKIKKPVVWKLPDMWPFSGASHYLSPGEPLRFQEGYNRENRPQKDRGLDLDRWLWRYKKYCWRNKDLTIVCPSKWLSDCARASVLFRRYNVHNIPNPIDLDLFKPIDKSVAKALLQLPENRKFILFGAINATGDRRKGFAHLRQSLDLLAAQDHLESVGLLVMGANKPSDGEGFGFDVRFLGQLKDDISIVAAYSAADVVVLPAEADNLPNLIKESMACGTPCVGFRVGGLPDMISHLQTGYLARPYQADDLANGIIWALSQQAANLSQLVRESAMTTHDPVKCVARYLTVYDDVLSGRKGQLARAR